MVVSSLSQAAKVKAATAIRKGSRRRLIFFDLVYLLVCLLFDVAAEDFDAAGEGGGEAVDGVGGLAGGGGRDGAVGALVDAQVSAVEGIVEDPASPRAYHIYEGAYAAVGEVEVVVVLVDGAGEAGDVDGDAVAVVEEAFDVVEQLFDMVEVAHHAGVEEERHHGGVVGVLLVSDVFAAQGGVAALAFGVGGGGGGLAALWVGLVVVEVEEEWEHEVDFGIRSLEFRAVGICCDSCF